MTACIASFYNQTFLIHFIIFEPLPIRFQPLLIKLQKQLSKVLIIFVYFESTTMNTDYCVVHYVPTFVRNENDSIE